MPKKRTITADSLFTSRIGYIALLGIFAVFCLCAVFLLKTKEAAFDFAFMQQATPKTEGVPKPEAFPVGVNPLRKEVVENTEVEIFLKEHYSYVPAKKEEKKRWFSKAIAFFAQFNWYQNLASPISRILVVDSGERKEEVARNFAQILGWSEPEKEQFAALIVDSAPKLQDGKFFPGHYVLSKDATPEEAAHALMDAFNTEVLARYPEEIDSIVPIEDTLIIASLLEREAYDFEDMRHISGIIWNRLFSDMNLQLDATLQYARANAGASSWWPPARPADKYLDSPFNTYKHKGLPPSPIANPSPEAIVAALNPKKTECLFYFHDSNGEFHCTVTYEEHVALLKEHYGNGR